jgi:hypothetical protein
MLRRLCALAHIAKSIVDIRAVRRRKVFASARTGIGPQRKVVGKVTNSWLPLRETFT